MKNITDFFFLSFEGFSNFASVTLTNISQCTIGSQMHIMYFSCLSSKSAADGAKVAGKVLANKKSKAILHKCLFLSKFVTVEILNYLSFPKNVTR